MSRIRLVVAVAAIPLILAGCQTDKTSDAGQPVLAAGATVESGSGAQEQAQRALNDGPLRKIMAELSVKASPEQSSQIATAIVASPQLALQLNDLAKVGLFDGIYVTNVRKGNIFKAYIDKTKIAITPDILQQIAHAQPFDVRSADSIPPNNLTFVLGHLAYHIRTAKTAPTVTKFNNPQAFSQAMVANEASAELEAWNYVVDAAEKQNGGKQLSVAQTGYLLVSLRYRGIFIKSGDQKAQHRLEYSPSGRLDLTPENISAMAATLSTTNVLDIE